MRWESEGIVLGFSIHNEKSYILEVLTKEHGRHKGLIRGIHSKNLRSVIEPGSVITIPDDSHAFQANELIEHIHRAKN